MALDFKKQKGFTLIELVVATGIFLIVSTLATGIFILNNKTQRRTQTTQQLQSELSFAFEKIAREIRFGFIYYPDFDGSLPSNTLELRDSQGNPIIFRLDAGASCHSAEPTAKCVVMGVDLNADGMLQDAEFTSLTTPDVMVHELRFYVFPTSDPFVDVSGFYSINNQPEVTLVLKASNVTTQIHERQTLLLQTTIVSRAYER
ncbi:MAG TPA: prepilin-type N-terminal cleavage/methylation domain-containing protein [Patescibacteria group bacterium]|nr:prepilin-type N-terminal cleavage/methylation domain-containing protein [Patescibacteria group bacterium]